MDLGADALIKTVVADFETAEGRSTARDGLKENIGGVRVSEAEKATLAEISSALKLAA